MYKDIVKMILINMYTIESNARNIVPINMGGGWGRDESTNLCFLQFHV